jgi:hypothetical protein
VGRRPAPRNLPSTKRIEDIAVGDRVWACDDSTGAVQSRAVVRLFRYTAHDTVRVCIRSACGRRDVITATAGHPFWVSGQGWLAASRLWSGDRLCSKDEEQASFVESLEPDAGPCDVFNFEVEALHNYFVGGPGILVHNASNGPGQDDDESTLLRLPVHWELPERTVVPVHDMDSALTRLLVERGRQHLHLLPADLANPVEVNGTWFPAILTARDVVRKADGKFFKGGFKEGGPSVADPRVFIVGNQPGKHSYIVPGEFGALQELARAGWAVADAYRLHYLDLYGNGPQLAYSMRRALIAGKPLKLKSFVNVLVDLGKIPLRNNDPEVSAILAIREAVLGTPVKLIDQFHDNREALAEAFPRVTYGSTRRLVRGIEAGIDNRVVPADTQALEFAEDERHQPPQRVRGQPGSEYLIMDPMMTLHPGDPPLMFKGNEVLPEALPTTYPAWMRFNLLYKLAIEAIWRARR